MSLLSCSRLSQGRLFTSCSFRDSSFPLFHLDSRKEQQKQGRNQLRHLSRGSESLFLPGLASLFSTFLESSSPPKCTRLACAPPKASCSQHSHYLNWQPFTSSSSNITKRAPKSRPIHLPAAAVKADPEVSRKELPFVLDAEFILQQCETTGLSETQYLTSLLPFYTALARPPISKFRVAAIGVGVSGRAYAGVNLEIKGLPLHHSIHAEQFVVANALQHGETKLKKIVVNHAPCGHCRQFLQELRDAEEMSIVIADARAEQRSLRHFLPHRFGPSDLLPGDFPLLLEPRHNNLSLIPSPSSPLPYQPHKPEAIGSLSANGAAKHCIGTEDSGNGAVKSANGAARSQNGSARAIADGDLSDSTASSSLVPAALGAANGSYAPYSDSPSGLALRLKSGEIFAGSYMESAAYNPSLPPLQSALVALVSHSPEMDLSNIAEALLVETRDAPVQHESSARTAIEHLNPRAKFFVMHAACDPLED